MRSKIVLGVIGLFLAGGVLVGLSVPTQQAQAAPQPVLQITPGPWRSTLIPLKETLAALPTTDNSYLESMLKREQLAVNNQATRLEMANNVAAATQAYIDEQKNMGKDTSALESTLAEFTQAISEATASHATAEALLASPAGFDANGQVTDRTAAQQTVRDVGRALRSTHLTITSATLDLRLAVQTYRTANS